MAMEKGASDVHFTVGIPESARIDGEIRPLMEEKLLPADSRALAESLMADKQKVTMAERGELDFAYSVPSIGRFRVNVFRQRNSYAMVLRILNLDIPKPEALGIPGSVVQAIQKRRGLILVTGATGSGKSTTLASLIDVLNDTTHGHIITMEDPIEYLHKHKGCIVNQREMGMDSESYSSALRASLRQDPDVILVGEMRDLDTISTAVTAAETGHMVFSTLHTIGAANTIDRVIDVFPPHQQQQIRTQLAEVLECVVSQQLLPKKEGKGRVAAFEIMHVTPAISNHIREGKTYQIPSVMQTNRKMGMITMDDCLLELYNSGRISYENTMSFAQDQASIKKRLF
ncbi:MAG: type IV pilus twitching motility protein PilT [Syntrophomonadaceae bacterium]|nr:type IV pilus twitching motility protein PilT [Syntrophomonadaceae bacterium]